MHPYQYVPLEDSSSIRLLTILPGEVDDPIRIEIKQESLVPPEKVESTRLSLEKIRRSLPDGWFARETLEGRLIFCHDETRTTSWVHPDMDIDRALYDPVPKAQACLSVPAYEALSYAWGAHEKDEVAEVMATRMNSASLYHISCLVLSCLVGSVRRAKSLSITHSLSVALRHLRYDDRPRTMWIDAICIDQNNEQERSEQVQRMGQIFLLASRVVAWLGPSFPGSCLALRTLARIGWQVELTKDNYLLPTPQCSHPDWVKFETRLPVGANELAALSQLCGLEYFERLWVIQELHLASARSVVRCGNDGIPWPLFRREILCILAKEQETTRTRCHVIRVANMSRWFQNIPMHKIIYLCRHRKCVDDRDRVYAVMNLLHPAVSKCIVVDYSRPAIDAFKQVFLVFLGQEQRLTQLKYARLRHLPRSSKTSSLSSEVWPTWLPNWSKHIRLTAPLEMTFSASGISAARAKNMPPGRLEITGLCFATVSIVHPPLRSSSKVLTDIVEMLNGLGLEQLQSSKYTTGETLLDVYLCTIVGGSIKDRVPGLPFPRLTELRDEVTSLAIHTESPEESKLPEFYRFKVRDQTVGACIFEMLNGYVGVLIGNPRPGDEVFIILGCDVPMLLRPTLGGEYRAVGDCYVHGIMDGEALLGALPRPWSVKAVNDERGVPSQQFRNDDKNITTRDDPRLVSVPIPAEWESMDFEWTPADPLYCRKFRNTNTGEVINSDPRLFPEALIEPGFTLKTITLV